MPLNYTTKATDPVSLPEGNGSAIAFSPRGDYAAVALQTTPYIAVYAYSPVTGFGTRAANPAAVPGGIARGIAWSPDGAYIAVVHAVSSGEPISVYPFANGAFGTKVADAGTTMGALTAGGVAWNPAGTFIAIASSSAAVIDVYAWSAGFGTKVSDPADPAAGAGNAIAWKPDGTAIAIATSSSPRVFVYPFSGGALGTIYADPATVPAGTGNGIAWSPDGTYIAVAHNTTPFVSAYPWSAGFGSKITNPGTLPASTGRSVAWTPDGTSIAVGHATTPFVSVYPWTTGFGTKVANASSLPTGQGNGVAFYPYSANSLFVAHITTPFVITYLGTSAVSVTRSSIVSYFTASANTDAARGTALLAACAFGTSGDAMTIVTGTLNVGASQVLFPAHVNVTGSGSTLTILQSTYNVTGGAADQKCNFCPGSSSTYTGMKFVGDVTVNNYALLLGFNLTAGDPVSTAVTLSDVATLAWSDGLYLKNATDQFPTTHYTCTNCNFTSYYDAVNAIAGDPSSPWPLTIDFSGCTYNVLDDGAAGSHPARGLSMASPVDGGMTYNDTNGVITVVAAGTGEAHSVNVNNGGTINLSGTSITSSSTGSGAVYDLYATGSGSLIAGTVSGSASKRHTATGGSITVPAAPSATIDQDTAPRSSSVQGSTSGFIPTGATIGGVAVTSFVYSPVMELSGRWSGTVAPTTPLGSQEVVLSDGDQDVSAGSVTVTAGETTTAYWRFGGNTIPDEMLDDVVGEGNEAVLIPL